MKITPLDGWIKEITYGDLPAYQLMKLNETLKTAQNSRYYRKTLRERLDSLSQLTSLPTIDAQTLTREGTGLVCVPQGDITRIVTLTTSGTSGEPKRVYFTEADQELTTDYFAHGLPTVVKPGGTMAILLPCERPGGVGDLIARALERIPVTPVRFGLVGSLAGCAETLRKSGADSFVGVPVQALCLARYCEARRIKLKVRSILLSTDNIPRAIVRELGRIWNCEVFEHYGMTETGLGGAIDCGAHSGYHIRENDLLFEVLDAVGNPLPDGEYGELAFTTLTRRGMPFIRYRTGDRTKILTGRCACGSELKRIAPIAGRIGGDITMVCGSVIRLRELDEVLFAIPQVCDFEVFVSPEKDLLQLDVDTQESVGNAPVEEIRKKLRDSGLVEGLTVDVSVTCHADKIPLRGAKRRLAAGQMLKTV